MAKETFLQARERLFRELPLLNVSHDLRYEAVTYNRGSVLKKPYLIVGRGYGYRGEPRHKLTFSAQAVHDESGHSLWVDIRGLSAEAFHKIVVEHSK